MFNHAALGYSKGSVTFGFVLYPLGLAHLGHLQHEFPIVTLDIKILRFICHANFANIYFPTY